MKYRVKAHVRKGRPVKAAMRTERIRVHSTSQIHDTLRHLSALHGGAWTYVLPDMSSWGDTAEFRQWASPSKVPANQLGWHRGPIEKFRMGWNGDLVGISEKTLVREQNRGIGGDR